MEQEWIAKDLPAAWERIDAVWGNAGFLRKLYFQLHWLQRERILEIMEFFFQFFCLSPPHISHCKWFLFYKSQHSLLLRALLLSDISLSPPINIFIGDFLKFLVEPIKSTCL